ncbi:segregation/condensation protein A [Nanoarchaeota archaeon]
MEDKVFNILFNEDEITWQSMLQELVKTEGMDPWDIDISLLTNKYIGMVKKIKETDLRVSGKVLLAAAILLKIKSNRLVGEDLLDFDRMLNPEEEEEYESEQQAKERPVVDAKLIPRTPQPRKRKVSIYDLVDALKQALEVKRRRGFLPEIKIEVPDKKVDISEVIQTLYGKICQLFKSHPSLTFNKLVQSNKREDKIYTFVPLLHLTNQRKIDLDQKQHFGEIGITLKEDNQVWEDLWEEKNVE